MPFICGCDKLTMKDGSIVRKGQPVPEADEWASNIQQANIRLGYIIKVKEAAGTPVPAAPSADSPTASQGDLSRPGNTAAGVSVKTVTRPQYGKGRR